MPLGVQGHKSVFDNGDDFLASECQMHTQGSV